LERRFPTDWSTVHIPKPEFWGAKVLRDVPIETLVDTIDWSPFFWTWELRGKYPKIFGDSTYGEHAKELFENAQAMLQQLIASRSVRAHAVYGFWPAASVDDDVILFEGEDRAKELTRFHFLRQQWQRKDQPHFRSLADYIAPLGSGRQDSIVELVVTAGDGVDELAKEYEKAGDDYNAIMVKAIADRLAESFAECLHRQARRDWGYGKDEGLDNEQLIDEQYRGIRPAPGYPACPDHTEKGTLFRLLDATKHTGVSLTESYAMWPASSVSGLYFAHPDARYFAVDRLNRDQLEIYARRKGMSIQEAERWLAPNLG